MAESNAVNPGGVGGVNPSAPVLSRTSTGGGGGIATRIGSGGEEGQKSFDTLMKMGGALLAPHIKEASQEQYMQGMAQAATGEALTDILKEQPWWTEIFAPSQAAMGARAYATQAAMAKFGADMEKKMPELASQGPEALMEAAQGFLKGVMTGDSMADGAILSTFTDQLQPMFKRHAKESYVYAQHKANAEQVQAWDTLSDVYQERAKASTNPQSGVSPEDAYADGTRLFGQVAMFPGQSPDSYQKNITNFLMGAARKGNFHAIKLFEEQGVVKALPPENQGMLQNAFRTSAREALNQVTPNYAVDMAQITRDTAQNPALIPERVRLFNEKVAKETGISSAYAQMIPNQSVDNVVGNVMSAQASANRLGMDNEQQLATARGQLSIPGGIANAVAMNIVPKAVTEQVAMEAWQSTQDPVKRAELINSRGAGSYTTIANALFTLGTGVTDKADTPGIQHVAQVYERLTEDAKAEYFDASRRGFYDQYTSAIKAGVPPEYAFVSAKVIPPIARNRIPESEKGEVQKSIRKFTEKRNQEWYGLNTLTDSSMRTLESVVARDLAASPGMHSTDTNVVRALSAATDRGEVQLVGEHAILSAVKGQTPIATILSAGRNHMGTKESAKALNHMIDTKAKAVGMSADNYTIIRANDVRGDFRLLVEFVDSDGKLSMQTIMGNELRDYNEPKAPEPTGGAAFGVYNPSIKRK